MEQQLGFELRGTGLKKPESFYEALENIATMVSTMQKKEQKVYLDKRTWKLIASEIDCLNLYVPLTPCEALFLAIIANEDEAHLSRIREALSLSKLETIKKMPVFDSLRAKHLITKTSERYSRYGNNYGYNYVFCITSSVREAIISDKKIEIGKGEIKDENEFFDELKSLFEALAGSPYSNDAMSADDFKAELNALKEDTSHTLFVRTLKKYGLDDFENINSIVFVSLCSLFVNDGAEKADIDDLGLRGFCERNSEARRIARELNERLPKQFEGLVEYYCAPDGMGDRDTLTLTKKAKKEFFADLNLSIRQKRIGEKNLIKSGGIIAKELFYNEKEERQINELISLLQKDNYKNITDKLKERGFRSGFACLFYGGPGTGKTETVYQIAKQTGRDIFAIDIDSMKSCWHGESEKIFKRTFDTYRHLVANSENAPILFFNEADALINKRTDISFNPAVEKSENAIQNIILQEMETLNGILIAATNLSDNLDRAFERRFLLKIEFSKPSLKARAAIWRSILKGLSEEDASFLAGEFNFSGGQIENIARRHTIDSIISQNKPSLERLISFCREEILSKDDSRAKIGFAGR
ncbi:MAG: ATP-binding protein [Elusimicrobiota bacterium]|jgi:hypothetical protein|nr:ATP-binding protein [Elusimicrobiota bacterium]